MDPMSLGEIILFVGGVALLTYGVLVGMGGRP